LPDPNADFMPEQAPGAVVFKNDTIRIPTQKDASVHKPAKDCTQCHPKKQMWGREKLIRQVPDLCYSCHTNYGKSAGYLHGPIVVGACLFCHNPHQSKYIHLQTAPQPDLCYQCHLSNDITQMEEHQGQLDVICTTCHDPHIGRLPKLIKPYREPVDDPNVIDL